MQVTLVGFVLIGLWVAAVFRGISATTYLTLLMVPLGAAAVINIPASGLSILALQGLAALTTGIAVLQLLATGRRNETSIPAAAWVLGLLCVYGVISAFALPRLFFHDVLVVPYQRAIDGVRMSEIFFTTLIPLAPTSSNISQPGYLLASFAFFLVMISVARLKGAGYLSRALLAAALLNAALGFMDMLRLDFLLDFIRTADYAIVADWSILGTDRLIGGFPEPSAFGSVCAIFAAYGLSIFFDRNDWIAGGIGIANGFFAVMALSSTGWFGLVVLGSFLILRTLFDIAVGGGGRRASIIMVLAFPVLVAIVAIIVLTPAGQYVMDMADRMIFSKGESASGLERGVWASEGFRVFRETFGFGAGLGSVRSNGIIPVILANVGWPGLVCAAVFMWLVFLKPTGLNRSASPETRNHRVLFRASLAATITALAMMVTTAVLVDPGILFFAFAAIAVCVRPQPQRAPAPRRRMVHAAR